jgi:hypothetical protein
MTKTNKVTMAGKALRTAGCMTTRRIWSCTLSCVEGALASVVAGVLLLVVLKALEPAGVAGAVPMAMPGFMVAVAVDIVVFALS